MRTFLTCVILTCLLMGCGSGQKDQAISIDQVPKNLLDIAKEKLPEVSFDQAVKKSSGVLEIRGKDKNGKTRDVEFSASGEIVEIE